MVGVRQRLGTTQCKEAAASTGYLVLPPVNAGQQSTGWLWNGAATVPAEDEQRVVGGSKRSAPDASRAIARKVA